MGGYNAVLGRNTADAPQAVGLSSQTVAFSHYNTLSAQLPVDPKTGERVAGGVKEQAEQCLNNIKAVVESIDQAMDDVVRLTVFLKDIADLDAVDEVFKGFFPDYVPTRTNVGVAALPMDAWYRSRPSFRTAWAPFERTAGERPVKVARTPTRHRPGRRERSFSHYNNITARCPSTQDRRPGGRWSCGAGPAVLANVKAVLEGIDVPLTTSSVNIFLKNLSILRP